MKSLVTSLYWCLAGLAPAATLLFEASLDGTQSGTSSPGTGFVTMQIDDVTGVWSLSGNFTSLNGTANNAHIHGPAAPGTTAGVVKALSFTAGASGTITGSDTTTATSPGTYSPAQINDLVNGLHYVNVHSTINPGGEIRGQLTQVPEASAGLLAAFGAMVTLRRRRR